MVNQTYLNIGVIFVDDVSIDASVIFCDGKCKKRWYYKNASLLFTTCLFYYTIISEMSELLQL